MKKTVQIVTVPLNKDSWSKGDIIINDEHTFIAIYNSEGFGDWQAQQLLVLSDDEIQAGDIITDKYKVWKWNDDCSLLGRKKVIASYPQLEGTLPISKETVQAWIDAGTPEECSVEMVGRCPLQTCDNPACRKECQEVEMVCKLWKGNLLLEFGEKGYSSEKFKNMVDNTSPEIKERIKNWFGEQDAKAYKLSIPTDEEISEKAKKSIEGTSTYIKENVVIAARLGYKQGYKQALKDLGHE
jgi:hypothetical protein